MFFKICCNFVFKLKNDEVKLVMVFFLKVNNGYLISISIDGCFMLIVLFKMNVYVIIKYIYKYVSEKIIKVYCCVLWLIILVLLF